MQILSSVVQYLVRAKLDARHQLGLCGRIGPKLVSHHHARGAALALEQFSHQTKGGALISAALQQGIKDIAVGIDGAPQPVLLSLDSHHHLIELPLVGKIASRPRSELMSELQAEFRHPFRDGLE